MTSQVGRPSVSDAGITLRLTDQALFILDSGATMLAANTRHKKSRAAWFRQLVEQCSPTRPSDLISAVDLRESWHAAWLAAPLPHSVTMRISEAHRVYLRQLECHIQSLDWSRELTRNESCLILICAHGPLLNRSLSLSSEE